MLFRSVATHEIYEAMTDPMTHGTGYRDASGWENGDKCTWYYGIDYQNGYFMQPEYNNGYDINSATNPYGTSATNPCPIFSN